MTLEERIALALQSVGYDIKAINAALTGLGGGLAPIAHTHSLSDITQSNALAGQVPTWNGQKWVPYDVLGGNNIPPGFMLATGGNSVLTLGDYKVHIFTSASNFTPLQNGVLDEVLVVGGGGGGGSRHGGGGGGGEVVRKFNHVVLANVAYPVVVGVAGLGASNGSPIGTNGGNTTFAGITALGGGRGGGIQFGVTGATGGSSAGGTAYGAWTTALAGTSSGALAGGESYVNAGGNGLTGNDYGGGGGGGAGGPGGNATLFGDEWSGYIRGGLGGEGFLSSITGIATRYAPGGGGSSTFDGMNYLPAYGPPIGGYGGGIGDYTDNNWTYHPPTSAAAYGGGGGGSRNSSFGGNGKQGILIVRYRFQ